MSVYPQRLECLNSLRGPAVVSGIHSKCLVFLLVEVNMLQARVFERWILLRQCGKCSKSLK